MDLSRTEAALPVGRRLSLMSKHRGFVLPIMFGALVDITGVRTSAFMLLYGTVCISLIWMHFSFRKETVAKGQAALATQH